MKTLLKLAWRNVLRNKRRTLLTVTMISFGVMASVFQISGIDGFNEQMVNSVTRLHLGHIQIHREGFHREMMVEKVISSPQSIEEMLRGERHLIGYVKRVKFQALLGSSIGSQAILVFGIEPSKEKSLTRLNDAITQGEFLTDASSDGNAIMIGTLLAKNLKVELGDKVVLIVQASDGSMGTEAFRVKGIFKTGFPEFDKNLAYIPISSAQSLLVYNHAISEFALWVDKSENVERLQHSLREKIPDSFEVLSWKELSPEMVAVMQINDLNLHISMAILFMIVAVGIINTLLMSLLERVHEFGILMAIGTKPKEIMRLIMMESFFLCVLGIVFGTILGSGVTLTIGHYGLDYSSFSDAIKQWVGLETRLHPILTPRALILTIFIVFITAVGAGIYPAIRAARLQPAEAIRHL